jgi:hypothetical protein
MFDATKIQDGLLGLVGVRQPFDPDYQLLDVANIASRSGRYLDDIPPFKAQYWIDTQDYKDISNADLNDQLRNIQRGAIAEVAHSVFGDNAYIDRNFLFSQATNRVDVENTVPNGFVGFEMQPSTTKDIAFKITRVRLEFEGTGTIKLVLFNSNLDAPIFTKDVIISSNSQIEELNWVLNNTNGDYKGQYFFGYIHDGTVLPFKRNYEADSFLNYLAEMRIEEVYISGAGPTEIFDLRDVKGLSENTGLNPDITVYSDYTDLILQNEHLFSRAVQIQWAINMMQRYVTTLRSNANERKAKDLALLTMTAIEGTPGDAPVQVTGLRFLLSREVESIKKTVKELKEGYFGGRAQVITMM